MPGGALSGSNPRRFCELPFAINDPAFGQVIGRQLDTDLVTRHDSDEMLAHSSSNMSHHLGSGLQLDSKPRIGECLSDGAFDLEGLFFFAQNGSLITVC